MHDMVRDALDHKRGLLAFQPVVASSHQDTPVCYECLIRIYDVEGKLIPAGAFMDRVENTHLGREIDCLSLDLGLRTLAENPSLRLSVNMSARSIGFRRWYDLLVRWVERDPSVGERLILELSEDSVMQLPELVVAFQRDCQAMGVAFALDDFGAGMTSFRSLRQFSFDIVKIDGSFVKNIAADEGNQSLVQALAMVAQQFDMLTIAESVETQQEAAFLKGIGIDCLQGYLFGAPTVSPPWMRAAQARTG